MYTQLFNLLCDKADDKYGGRLPVHVRFILDEFSNIGQIPKFEKLIATIRSREISASIILQAQSQLKALGSILKGYVPKGISSIINVFFKVLYFLWCFFNKKVTVFILIKLYAFNFV